MRDYNKYVTVKKCKELILKLDPNAVQEDDNFKVAVILMYGSLTGKHHSKTLAAKTKYELPFVTKTVSNFKKNEIWVDGKTLASWNDPEYGGTEFWLHVAVGMGFIERSKN